MFEEQLRLNSPLLSEFYISLLLLVPRDLLLYYFSSVFEVVEVIKHWISVGEVSKTYG